ncbi:PA14 domain-containing protein [Bacillus thuringiensis]|uniref:PA14 domain-containing protein n=1 Tax=Bacillus thuringiensis TaxID=1428 RepID=UPI001580E9A4|nr:PA14 domain-containing protein [Bacillus thuringiensis]NUH91352.1 C39 family peptidase [Bacillus thuringiensis]NUH96673.1 C39 family peptidase [Bacillus thuringiensis]NUI02021.1 C39 family peptidase [Bacillus thuringiensis]NUI07203.1 C39 family peptidase [Bacillus thuringiensis]NUI15212.1 C39 family peptidase [Bacillus thuringiensis]
MKKLILSASCTLACGILLSSPEYSKAEEVSKQPTVTKEEAQYKAESYIKGVSEKSHQNWKDAQIGQSTILYDLEGKITGYAFQVKKDHQDKGYIIASSEKQAPSIIESTREGKYPYQQVEEGKSIYTGPLQHYKKVDQTIVNLHTEQTIDIKTAKQQIETTKPKDSTERSFSPKKKLAQEQPAFKENSIPNVPDNQWYYGCTPTAVSNIAEYWAQNGYNNLKYSNETTNQIIEKLGKIMKTIPGKKLPGRAEGGTTIINDMVPGIKKYWNERGYYPEINLDTTPTYEEYTKEIDEGRPITVNIINDPFYSNHTVTGVGYEQMYIPEINEDFKNLVLHDTWEDSPVEAYYSYNDSQKYIHSTITIKPFIHKEKKSQVHYNWGSGGPFANHTDDFMVKFDQSQNLNAGDYFVQTVADDYIKVAFDGKIIIDGWNDNSIGQTKRSLVTKVKSGNHSINTDYYEKTGNAAVFSDIVPFDHWLAYYYPNKNLGGSEPVDAKIIAPQGPEKALVENNGEGSPTPKVPANDFSARYTTVKRLPAGEYIIRGKADDGMKVFIDGKLVLDEWSTGNWNKEHAKKITIRDNESAWAFGSTNEKDTHLVEVQYFEAGSLSHVKFSIDPYKDAIQNETWTAEYYNNTELQGDAIVVGGKNSNDKIEKIDFDWKENSPVANIRNDNFSARFTKLDTFEQGNYYFEAKADDGVRVYVDDKKIIDSWIPSAGDVRSVKVPMSAGKHKITVEYMELTSHALLQMTYKKQ